MTATKRLRGYLLVTLCYWGFTLSDGALRMLVLLHLHERARPRGGSRWCCCPTRPRAC